MFPSHDQGDENSIRVGDYFIEPNFYAIPRSYPISHGMDEGIVTEFTAEFNPKVYDLDGNQIELSNEDMQFLIKSLEATCAIVNRIES